MNIFEKMRQARKEAKEKKMGYVADNLKDLQKEFPNAMANVVCGAECGDGWKQILREVLAVYEAKGAQVVQIKEKFGGLRVYFDPPEGGWKADGDFKACSEAEKKAETASFKTCEECGQPGTRHNEGWIKTYCDDCEASREVRSAARLEQWKAERAKAKEDAAKKDS